MLQSVYYASDKGIFLLVKNSLIFISLSSNIYKSTTATNAIKAEKDQNGDYSLTGKFAIYKNPLNYKTNFDKQFRYFEIIPDSFPKREV